LGGGSDVVETTADGRQTTERNRTVVATTRDGRLTTFAFIQGPATEEDDIVRPWVTSEFIRGPLTEADDTVSTRDPKEKKVERDLKKRKGKRMGDLKT